MISSSTDAPTPGDTATNSEDKMAELPPESPLLKSRIVGTTSAKLSYLISEILKYYQHEKILVFYDGTNAAYYIAQMLDILHIRHEIYAKSLKAAQKSEYAVRFDQEDQDRVLLMDVHQAAFGLNLPAASRIYFVNPVCRENVEAQAIKRAHRIGQKKSVHVETLVLKGTIEEKMLDRSKRMTRAEHLNASHLEDDGGIKHIIQSATPLPVESFELGEPQMAALDVPQRVWCREGWREYKLATQRGQGKKRKAAGDADDEAEGKPEGRRKKKVVRRTLAFVDCRTPERGESSGAGRQLSTLRDEAVEMSDATASTAQHHPFRSEEGAAAHLLPAFPLPPPRPQQSPLATPSASSPPGSTFPKVSISSLLDDGPTLPGRDSFAHNDVIQDILRRL